MKQLEPALDAGRSSLIAKMFKICLLVLFVSFVLQIVGNEQVPASTQSSHPIPKLIDITNDEIQQGLEKGRFTSVDLVKAYIDRIREVNATLHMVTEVNPDALSIARELDKERANGHVRGPLHGVPILIKNNIATDDLMNNTAGSFSLLGARVPRDSTIAKKLRNAGIIILGKSNLSQWANFRSFNTSNGWSAYGGQTEGAYYPKQDPSGSSSGSGVSSSIGLALAALGTETDGSIVSPSENNNLVGIKPSVGLTSRYLVIPISQHQDTVGPMARTVKDAAYLLQAIAGYDPRDNYTSAIPFKGHLPNYVAACNFSGLEGARLGVPRNVISAYTGGKEDSPRIVAFNKALTLMEKAGATIVDSNFTALEKFFKSDSETTVLYADFIVDLKNYLDELVYNPMKVHNLAQVDNFTKAFRQEQWPRRDVKVWTSTLDLGFNNTSPEFWKAYQEDLYLGGPGGLLGAIERHKLDAVLLPTEFSSSFAAIVGAPIITVPLGFLPSDTPVSMNGFGNLVASGPNIPFGLSFLGARFTEQKLIPLAYAYEQRTHTRNKIQPYIVPNTELKDVM